MKTAECMAVIKQAVAYAKEDGIVTAYNWREALKEKTVVSFGLGKFFRDTSDRLFRMLDVKYVCDNNSKFWGGYFLGRRCISPEELLHLENVFVVIVMGDCTAVMKQLKGMDIPFIPVTELHFSDYEKGKSCAWLENALPNIEKALTIFADEKSREVFTKVFCNKIYLSRTDTPYHTFQSAGEYFETGCIALGDEEYFVDGGAYTGDTVEEFVRQTKGRFSAVYSFEYEAGNYKRLCEALDQYPPELRSRIKAWPLGIWDRKETGWCEYLGESDGTQLMSEESRSNQAEPCSLDKLDDVLADRKVTVMKLDIEGAEIHGLHGAEGIIRQQKPKLAVCLYHTPEHLWEVPLLIHRMRPDYRMYVRHHNVQNYTDTVLYAR